MKEREPVRNFGASAGGGGKRRSFCRFAATVTALAMVCALSVFAAGSPLFPAPFLVEHRVQIFEHDQVEVTGESVTDYYAGSRIVSVRPDGSRMVVDFERREITEIRPAVGTWSAIGFSRFADLRRRLARVERPAVKRNPGVALRPEIEEIAGNPSTEGPFASPLQARNGVRHLRVRASGSGFSTERVDAWLDPAIRLDSRAQQALSEFESGVLGETTQAGADAPSSLAGILSAVRSRGDGAFVIRLRRPLSASRISDDLATRLEQVSAIPPGLDVVPESFRRVPHPLEMVVAGLEDDRASSTAAIGEGEGL